MKNFLLFIIIFTIILLSLSSCTEKEKPQLLFYIGITMVKPVNQLVKEFESENNCSIKIIQGGSQDLYDSLKASNEGDLYMPGSYSYRENNIDDGLLLDAVPVGYNKASLVVAKGNPKNFTNDLSQLIDANNKIVLCNPDSGSIGRESKKILDAYGIFDKVFSNAIYLTTDSRNLTDAIESGHADICINWYATTTWKENKKSVDAILIDEKYAKKKMLIMNLLKSSNHPELTKKFMDYASSDHGREIFKNYGFLDDTDLKNIDGVDFEWLMTVKMDHAIYQFLWW